MNLIKIAKKVTVIEPSGHETLWDSDTRKPIPLLTGKTDGGNKGGKNLFDHLESFIELFKGRLGGSKLDTQDKSYSERQLKGIEGKMDDLESAVKQKDAKSIAQQLSGICLTFSQIGNTIKRNMKSDKDLIEAYNTLVDALQKAANKFISDGARPTMQKI